MTRITFLIIFSLGMTSKNFSQTYTIPEEVQRIVFIGNSITYGGTYVDLIDAYFAIHYPDKAYEIINVGLPSETVSGLSEENHAGGKFPRPDLDERLDRVLEKTKPDLVFTCYGMNDGIYLPFDEKRFGKFKKGILWLDKKLKKAGTEILHITPPIYDERKGAAYANVLDIYSDWLLSKQYTDAWKVIDIHWPMQKKLEDNRLVDPNFAFAKDGIHPNEAGHFEMAKQILLYLGEEKLAMIDKKEALFASHPKGMEVLKLIQEHQQITKDAWLTDIGHKRPGMNKGLPLKEALEKAKAIDEQIKKLIKY